VKQTNVKQGKYNQIINVDLQDNYFKARTLNLSLTEETLENIFKRSKAPSIAYRSSVA
jgi:hypothetical protein